MTRSFNNQSIPTLIMPRVSFVSFVLCWIGLFIFMVRADLKKQTNPPQLLADGAANSAASFQKHVRCECEFFVQSWKTSHMIRLPMGMIFFLHRNLVSGSWLVLALFNCVVTISSIDVVPFKKPFSALEACKNAHWKFFKNFVTFHIW